MCSNIFFPSIIALCYYQFKVLLLYVCIYFFKFPFWIVNGDLLVLTQEAADKLPSVVCVPWLSVSITTVLQPHLHPFISILRSFNPEN